MPGRLIGVSKDAQGNRAYRLALQTREQHIRREKATSNICTAQALLANMASLYAVYHGPEGIKEIASRIHSMAILFAESIKHLGHRVKYANFFDTVVIELGCESKDILDFADESDINLRLIDRNTVSVTFDETETRESLLKLIRVFSSGSFINMYKFGVGRQSFHPLPNIDEISLDLELGDPSVKQGTIPSQLVRQTKFLTHPVFNSYHSETEMLRYITHLQSKDLSLANAMIPLGIPFLQYQMNIQLLLKQVHVQ